MSRLAVRQVPYRNSLGFLRNPPRRRRDLPTAVFTTPTEWDNGNCIYLFKHVRTHQVVYSLTHWIDEPRIMKQLTFYGKKTVPAQFRKDLWRPFATVVFPVPQTTEPDESAELENPDSNEDELGLLKKTEFANRKLGELAFQKLRELRLLRDYSWRPPGKPMAVSAERRNGTAEPLWPPIANRRARKRREAKMDKKERQQWLMDQRGASVADLSTVIEKVNHFLIEHTGPLQLVEEQDALLERWTKTQNIALSAQNGELATVEQKLSDWSENASKEQKAKSKGQNLQALRSKRKIMIRALMTVKLVQSLGIPLDKGLESININQDAKSPVFLSREWRTLVKQMQFRYNPAYRNEHTWTQEDLNDKFPIQIYWADLLDRTYVTAWPENTYHQRMGPRAGSDLYYGAIPPSTSTLENFEIPKDREFKVRTRKDHITPQTEEAMRELEELQQRIKDRESAVRSKLGDIEDEEFQLARDSLKLDGEPKSDAEKEDLEYLSRNRELLDLSQRKAELEGEKTLLRKTLQNINQAMSELEDKVPEDDGVEVNREVFQGNENIKADDEAVAKGTSADELKFIRNTDMEVPEPIKPWWSRALESIRNIRVR